MFFEDIGLKVPRILLPKKGVDLSRWAVIACDQFNHDRGYWKDVRDYVGGSPSTLNVILPETYLGEVDLEVEREKIVSTMDGYRTNVLEDVGEGFVLVERTLASGDVRHGLVVALDLEAYDYSPDAKTLIRTTEGTYLDKVHPRVKIRRKACIESPHILVLIDDPGKTVIEPLFEKGFDKIYDFQLMKEGGRISGYLVDEPDEVEGVAQRLRSLSEPHNFSLRYGVGDEPVFLYAMGDGNHSFATAKLVWEEIKSNAEDSADLVDHPARYALVELINIHDGGLKVEPIHRLVDGMSLKEFKEGITSYLSLKGAKVFFTESESFEDAVSYADNARGDGVQAFVYCTGLQSGVVVVESSPFEMEMESLESFVESKMRADDCVCMSFIHGAETTKHLAQEQGAVGFILPDWSKHDIFKRVLKNGPFPKKTFSMGEAREKKYYLECRKIVR